VLKRDRRKEEKYAGSSKRSAENAASGAGHAQTKGLNSMLDSLRNFFLLLVVLCLLFFWLGFLVGVVCKRENDRGVSGTRDENNSREAFTRNYGEARKEDP